MTPAIPAPRQPRTLLQSRAARASALAPASVSSASWELFIFHVDVARHGGPLTGGGLRRAVCVVVTEMRAAAESWDAVYSALGAVVTEAPTGPVEYSPEHTHANRAAALVAHMHSWADCVRLDELEENEDEEGGTEGLGMCRPG
jgi:hypothetical protein